MDIYSLIVILVLCIIITTTTTRGSSQRTEPEQRLWNEVRLPDLIADVVASSREGCQLGKDLSEKMLRTRMLKSRRLQKLVRRRARRDQLTILNTTLHSSSLEHSLNTNLLSDYTGIQKYRKLFKTVRKHSRVSRRLMRRMRNKLNALATQLRQVIVYRGQLPVTIPPKPADVSRELDRRRDMDGVEKCIHDYAIQREIRQFLNAMGMLYTTYHNYLQRITSERAVCF